MTLSSPTLEQNSGPEVLWHYCSLNSFMGIVTSKSLWLSELTQSNDSQEGSYTWNAVEGLLRSRGIKGSDIQIAKEHFDFALGFNSPRGFCFSGTRDLLSQWRSYGDDGFGVSIGLPTLFVRRIIDERLKDQGVSLQRVVYSLDKISEEIEEFVDAAAKEIQRGAFTQPTLVIAASDPSSVKAQERAYRNFQYAFAPFIALSYQFKHSAFAEENEWRLMKINLQHKDPDPSLQSLSANALRHFRATRSRLIPFLPLSFAEDRPIPIRVVLGPKNQTSLPSVARFVQAYGFQVDELSQSAAPYR